MRLHLVSDFCAPDPVWFHFLGFFPSIYAIAAQLRWINLYPYYCTACAWQACLNALSQQYV